jgi:hypothetical protein
MGTTSTQASSPGLDFAGLLLGVLGFTDDEFVSLLYEDADGWPHTAVMAPADAVEVAATIPATANAYFGVCPVRGPARKHSGRGTGADVTRLSALWADLDVKPGGCSSFDVARTVIDDVSMLVGDRPSAVVNSGHGLHPYWPVGDGQVIGDDVGPARALLTRWGRLVVVAAEKRGVVVDDVFDLARMLRIPGTYNNKAAQ